MKFSNNAVLSAVNKFQNHPSILKIKSNRTYSGFSFRPVYYEEVLTELINLDMSKTSQLEEILTILTVDITPVFKKGDKYDKSNYRPVSILPILSKVYEKCLYKQ